MKFNSRLLISELCAAAATALVSAILIAGCASGERTGKFWDKGDIKSSDDYVAAERARDQSIAAKSHTAPSTSGKVAFTSGTDDGTTGHVSVPDFSDPPSAPPAASATAISSGKADAGSAAARSAQNAGAAARGAQNAGAAVGNAQIAGTTAGGSIIAPYVQKRAPSGPLDNNCHDGEIMKPKTVAAKKLDPFTETDAEPFLAPSGLAQQAATPATALVNSAATSPAAAAPPTTAHRTPPSGKAFAESGSAQAPVASTKADSNLVPMELVRDERPSPPSVPSSVSAPAASVNAFDASTPPPVPTQPMPERIATVMPAPPAFVRPKSRVLAPARPHSGIRLGDEDLDEDQQSPARPEEKQVVESAATQPPPEARASVAATPYEADTTHHEADTRTCVTSPPPAVGNPARTTTPPAPPGQDSWESTRTSEPETSSSRPSVPVAPPVNVTAVVPATAEPSPVQQAAATPATVPLFAIPQRIVPHPVAPTKTAAMRESVALPKVVEQPKPSGGADPMICDSASVHGRYTGDDTPPLAPSTPNPFDAAPASRVRPPVKKPNKPIEGKSTSFWDDPFGSPALKHTVLTADFSVSEADDSQRIGLKSASTVPAALAAIRSAHETGRSRSHAWFVIGMVAGLALSAVVWRRWRDHSGPPSEPQPD